MTEYRDYRTEYGVIHFKPEACTDDYSNYVTYSQGDGNTVLTLQRPAMKAFWAAEIRYARRLGWSDKRIADNGGHGRAIKVLPGTNRSCETQRRLYAEDSSRYAHPNVTGHTRGIAIDIDQSQPNLDLIDRALRAEGWRWVRPIDEPWHASFGPVV